MEKIEVNGRVVGEIIGRDFVKHVKPKNLYYKYQSWTLTKDVVYDLKERGIKRIILEYSNKDIHYKMWLTVEEFILLGIEYIKEDEKRIMVHKSKWHMEDANQLKLV